MKKEYWVLDAGFQRVRAKEDDDGICRYIYEAFSSTASAKNFAESRAMDHPGEKFYVVGVESSFVVSGIEEEVYE